MKLTTVLLLTMLLKVSAEGYAQKVTLTESDSSLESVFKKITRQTGYVFFYSDDLLKDALPVSVDIRNMPLQDALRQVFLNQPFVFLVSDKTIAVRKKNNSIPVNGYTVRTPVIRINGKVVDATTGEPIQGATVLVKGKGTGTKTDAKGEFRLVTPEGNTIQISYIGYEVYEEKVMTDVNLVIRLVQKPQEMKVTVVTGIFNRKLSSYTGSAVTITNEDLRRVGNANLFQALRNISPSLVLDNLSMGSNPNALPDIQLRGTSTFPADQSELNTRLKGNYLKNPNEPLFILDGFEASVERIFDLDINRIERVTLLKDAASKAIYGAKAANGVVVIETKKITSAKALVTYNASVDVDLPDLTSYNLSNALEKLEAEQIDGMYIPKINDAAQYTALQQLYNSRKKLALEGLNTYWMAKPLRDGIGHKHTLSVELGNNQGLSMLADLSYRQVNGVMKGSQRKNFSGNVTASYRVRNLLFRNIMSATKNNNEESPYGTFNEYAIMNPYWRAVNTDGTIPYYAEIGPNGTRYTNPLFNSTLNTKVASDYFNFTNNFYLEWNILPGLRSTTRIGIDVKNSGADEFYPSSHTKFENFTSEEQLKRKGSYQVNNGKSTYLSGDMNLSYSRERNRHFYFANAGFNISERRFNEVIHKVEGFASDRMDNILFGRGYGIDSRPVGIDGIQRDMGFLGAASYMYDNRFLTDLTLRLNASSQFGAEKRWAKFWSVGLGWNLHNEVFMQKNLRFIEQLKIRGSVGSTGNPNFASNASIATYQYFLESLYQGFPGSYVSNMANAGLQWETKLDYNVGFDAKISTVNLRFDYYESFTENLVTSITIPNSTGFDYVKDNLGRVKNSGFEIFASWLAWSKGRNFISINAGIETNKNRIVELSNAMKSFNDRMDKQANDRSTSKPVKKYIDGMSMNAIWAVPSLGIDPATGNEIYLKRDGSTTYEWNAADMVVAGNSQPAYQGIFGLSAEFNGIGINVTGRYLGGGQLYNQTLVDKVENVDMNYNVDKRVLTGRWLKPGQHALFKRLGTYTKDTDGDNVFEVYDEKTRATTRFVQDRNELDIAAINVYYLFNTRLVRKLGMQRLKVGFNMNEIAKISSIRIERGTQYPFARTLSFSLSATF